MVAAEQFERHIERGLTCRIRSEFAEAIEQFREACALQPGSLGARCELAFSYLQAGALEQAWAGYLAVHEADAANIDALAGLGELCRRRRDLPAALRYVQAALARDPCRAALRLELAKVLLDLGRLDEATDALNGVLAADPTNWVALVELGILARRRGEHLRSLERFRQAADLHPMHPGIRSELAFTLRLLGRIDEAEAAYRSVMNDAPAAAAPLHGLSAIALERGEFAAALGFAQRACQLDKTDIDARLKLCALHRELGQIAEAALLIAKILAIAPDNADAWIEQGQVLRARDDRPSALAAFRNAARLDPARGQSEMAAELLALGQPAAARAACAALLAVHPGHLGALTVCAEIALLAGDHASCVEACDTAIAHHPQAPAPYREKCRALVCAGRADEALRIADERFRALPDSLDAVALRLEVLRACGRRSQALDMLAGPPFAAARNFAPWFEALQARLAFFDLDGAAAMLGTPPVLRLAERARVLCAAGQLADLQWRVTDAIAAYERALDIRGTDPEAHHQLARLHLLRGDAQRAAAHLRISIAQNGAALVLRGQSSNPSQTLPGQLLNEMRLAPSLSASLASVADEAPERQAGLLREIAAANPASTAAALCLMRALRQAGVFAALDPPGEGRLAKLPRRIMQYRDEAHPPEPIATRLRGWVEAHPGYQYCRFDRGAAIEYLAGHDAGAYLKAFLRARDRTQAGDIFRLVWLFHEGGFSIDAEQHCVGHLSAIAGPDAVLIAHQQPYATLGTSLLGCIPGEPVIGRALALAVQSVLRGDADNVWLATGPGLLTRAFVEMLVAAEGQGGAWLAERRVLDRGEFAGVCRCRSVT